MNFTHEIKAWPEYYAQIESGEMTFNIRNDDRGYSEGDILIISEFVPESRTYPERKYGDFTGRKLKRRINRVFRNIPGLEYGYVAMTLLPMVER